MFALDGQGILSLVLQLGGAGGFAYASTEIVKRLESIKRINEGQTGRLRAFAWFAGAVYTVAMGLSTNTLDPAQFQDILKTGVETIGALLIAHSIHKGTKALG